MTNLELVERLRERADITYNEANEALEASGNDLLEAMIILEKQGKIIPPKKGGYYTSRQNGEADKEYYGGAHNDRYKTNSGTEAFTKFIRFCGKVIHKANTNMLEIIRNGKRVIALPLSVMVILILIGWWWVLAALVVGLFFGFRYRFRGADVENTNINNAMDAASNAAENLKEEISNKISDANNR